jgi:hypothetical protein
VEFIDHQFVSFIATKNPAWSRSGKKVGEAFGFRAVAVDSDASTCNHAIHEFFVSTSCSHLVAPLIARGQ